MDAVVKLIDEIYEAGTHPEHWPVVLNAVADAVGGIAATMGGATTSHTPFLVAPRTDPDRVRSYAEHYHVRNLFIAALLRHPTGPVFVDSAVLPRDEFRASAFYNEWCRPQSFLFGFGSHLATDEGRRAIIMINRAKPHETADIEVYAVLAPHLRRAFALNQALHAAKSVDNGIMAAISELAMGAVLVAGTGVIRSTNDAADALLRQNDGLRTDQGRVTCALPEETDALLTLIARCGRGAVTDSGGRMRVTRAGGRAALSVLCVPFPKDPHWLGSPPPAAMLFVTDPDIKLEQQARRLQARFGLTPAEAAFATEIGKADGREKAAARRGISLSTARTHLSAIFEKTGVHRQAELIRLLNDDAT